MKVGCLSGAYQILKPQGRRTQAYRKSMKRFLQRQKNKLTYERPDSLKKRFLQSQQQVYTSPLFPLKKSKISKILVVSSANWISMMSSSNLKNHKKNCKIPLIVRELDDRLNDSNLSNSLILARYHHESETLNSPPKRASKSTVRAKPSVRHRAYRAC